jgi:DNA polymerase-3 subunit gamma/tau
MTEDAAQANQKTGSGGDYVVLARRYRPMQFEEVIGQQHVTQTLQNAIRANRVHHAYLFTGSRGVGKTTVARILARALNHPDGPTPTPPPPEPDASQAVDVIEIDGASHTGVDDVRELRESVRYLPSGSRYKIYIIDEVHMLSTSAFNALLKTLEEPPAHVVFVFATTEPHKIPATILSRCQRFDFKRVATPVLVEHQKKLLEQERIEVEPAGLATIARAAEGGVRDSLSLLDQVIAFASSDVETTVITAKQVAEVLGVADRRSLFALSAALLDRDAKAALSVVQTLFADGHDLSQFSHAFVAHLRDLVVVASCDNPGPLVEATEAELSDLVTQAQTGGRSLWQQHFDRFAHTAEQIARSTFSKLLLEMVLVEMAHAEPLMPLGDLLDRLEQLERRTAGSRPAPGSPGGGSGHRAPARKAPARGPSSGGMRADSSASAISTEQARSNVSAEVAFAHGPLLAAEGALSVQGAGSPPPAHGAVGPSPRAPAGRSPEAAPEGREGHEPNDHIDVTQEGAIPSPSGEQSAASLGVGPQGSPACEDNTAPRQDNGNGKGLTLEDMTAVSSSGLTFSPPASVMKAIAEQNGEQPPASSSDAPAQSADPAELETTELEGLDPEPGPTAEPPAPTAEPPAPAAEPPAPTAEAPAPTAEAPAPTTGGVEQGATNGQDINIALADLSEMERWQRLLKRLGGPQAATFASGRLLSWEGCDVVLGYPTGDFQLGMANNDERRRAVEDRLSEILGKPVRITARELTEQEQNSPQMAQLSAMEADQERVREDRRKLQDEARSHPITRALVSDFGAQIRSVRTALDSKQSR